MILIITLITILLMGSAYLIGWIIRRRQEREERELIELEQEINYYLKKLEQVKQEYETMKPNDITNLPEGTNNILNMYDRSNIRIPKDILEDISSQHFHNETDILEFIENQRNYWKLENTKKLYKRR